MKLIGGIKYYTGFSDESASDLICQDDLNATDVSEDLNFYFSNLTDADTSLKVLCCSNGKFFYVLYPNKVLTTSMSVFATT